MVITVNSTVLEKNSLTLNEFLILFTISKQVNIEDSIESLLQKGLITRNVFKEGEYVISDNVKNMLTSVIIDSDKQIVTKEQEFEELATELQEVFPKGKKPGTTYAWRCSKAEIVQKLKTLVAKYNFKFTKEQALKATREYVSSFNGEYSKMRLLKYFILKADRENGGIVSDFMSLIENDGQEDTNNWTDNVI